MFKSVSSLGLSLLVALSTWSTGAPARASSTSTEVELASITTPLVPKTLVKGDREFGGNGPLIYTKLQLQVSEDKRSLKAKIWFRAVEDGGDKSTTEESFKVKVFSAPEGKRIRSIEGPAVSEVNFRSEAAGMQILGPGEDFQEFLRTLEQAVRELMQAINYLEGRSGNTREMNAAQEVVSRVRSGAAGITFAGNHVHVVNPPTGPVAAFAIVGDTGGDDISKDDNPKDDTRIQSILFKKVRIVYE